MADMELSDEEIHELLNRHNRKLVECIDLSPPFLQVLREKGSLTTDEYDELTSKQVEVILDFIRRHPLGFGGFLSALESTDQHHIIDLLRPNQDDYQAGNQKDKGISDAVDNTSNDVSMQVIVTIVQCLGGNWLSLGVRLGLKGDQLDALCQPRRGGPEMNCFWMLNKWRQKNGNLSFNEMVVKVTDALRNIKREDQVEVIQNYVQNNEPNIDLVFQDISRNLSKNWKEIGLILGLTSNDLDLITDQLLPDNPALHMLEMWWKATPAQQRRPELITALTKLERMDLVKELETKSQAPSARSTDKRGFYRNESNPQVKEALLTVAASINKTRSKSVAEVRLMLHTFTPGLNDFSKERKMFYSPRMEEIDRLNVPLPERSELLDFPTIYLHMITSETGEWRVMQFSNGKILHSLQTKRAIDGRDVLKLPHNGANHRSELLGNFILENLTSFNPVLCNIHCSFKYSDGTDLHFPITVILPKTQDHREQAASPEVMRQPPDRRTIIDMNGPCLLQTIRMDPLLRIELVKRRVISVGQMYDLEAKSPIEETAHLLSYIRAGSIAMYHGFRASLIETNRQSAADLLPPDVS